MSDWWSVFDGVFFMGIATLLFACLSLVIKTAYKSKCKNCALCFGLIKIERDTENEEKIDIENKGAEDKGVEEKTNN